MTSGCRCVSETNESLKRTYTDVGEDGMDEGEREPTRSGKVLLRILHVMLCIR